MREGSASAMRGGYEKWTTHSTKLVRRLASELRQRLQSQHPRALKLVLRVLRVETEPPPPVSILPASFLQA